MVISCLCSLPDVGSTASFQNVVLKKDLMTEKVQYLCQFNKHLCDIL